MECLESRELLAANQITLNPLNQAIVIEGTADWDQAHVSVDAANVVQVRLVNTMGGAAASFSKSTVAHVQFLGGEGADKFTNLTDLPSYALGEGGDDELIGGTGANYLNGGSGDDRISGNIAADYLDGGDGSDEMHGRGGDDYLVGGLGDDGLYGDDGNDQLFGQDGKDFLDGAAGVDRLSGGTGDDYLVGGADNDGLYGNEGNDQLFGQDGADYLEGGAGVDELRGGIGDDYLVGGDGADGLYGEDGHDQLFGQDGDDYLSGAAGNDRLWGGSGEDYLAGDIGDDRLHGQDDNDQLFGHDGDDYLDGGAAVDQLWGGLGDDLMLGGAGDDGMFGQDGSDQLFGQDGNDFLDGGVGNDRLLGSVGDDYLVGALGNDWLFGGDGHDRLLGLEGDDSIDGGAGNDTIQGGLGDDGLLGGAGTDHLSGNEGNDYLLGGTSGDTLAGGIGNDVLIGGEGVDALLGEGDDDILIGGTTKYDGDPAQLRALVSAWSAAGTYLSRIQAIEDEQFTARLESRETVYHDQIDSLAGNAGQDWFFVTGYAGTYVPPGTEMQGHEHGAHSGHQHSQVILGALPELEGFEFVDSLDRMIDRQSNELIHTLVPHSDNLTLQREHLTLYELVRYDRVTHSALRSGAWTDPATWQNGIVPSAGARVLIPLGVHVEVNGIIQDRLATVRVDGTLSFNNTVNTELRADTIVVTSSGAFEMGTESAPIVNGVRARLLITDNGPIDRSWDPFGISRGLISLGRVAIHGAAVSPYANLSGSATAGTNVLTLLWMPLNWQVGDAIVVAATTEGTTQNEYRQIVAINGTQITLDRPLDYNHTSPASNLEIHVAHLTRNAVIESESTAIERRGHVMFMHNRDVHIGSGGFYKLGRTNKLVPINDAVVGADWTLQSGTGTNVRARYPIHFHRNGLTNDGNPSTIVGSAVVDAPGWGFVNHSSYVEMTANVAFNVTGAAFSTEVGDEIGGFDGNLAIGSWGSGEGIDSRFQVQDFGHQGDGFWFQGAGISVVNNIAAGNQGTAFVYYNNGLFENGVRRQFLAANLSDPSLAGGADTIQIVFVPIKQFSGNIGYASTTGLSFRHHLEHSPHGGRSLVTDSQFWNNSLGVNLHYTESVTLRRVSVIHDASSRPLNGLQTNIFEGHIHYENLTVGGYTNGIQLPRWGNNVVSGGTFFNHAADIVIPTAMVHERIVIIGGQSQQTKIWASPSLISYPYSDVANFFVNDVVLLYFGTLLNQRLYSTIQAASAIPFPTPREDAPSQYIGLTNQQLKDQFGVSIGNAIAPINAYTVPLIGGLIAPHV